MKKPILIKTLAGLLVACACIVPSKSFADYTTKIDPNVSSVTWQGWGCSLAWWANVYGSRDDMADLLFTTGTVNFNGQSLPGLGLNIVRYNAGACSWNSGPDGSRMVVSPNIPQFRQMAGYWKDWANADMNSGSWDWTVDGPQRYMMSRARDRGVNHFELFANSPMWWMCYNHNPSGNGGSDNLQSWNYQAHAHYLASIAKYAHDNWGITFDSVDTFNEPSANWWTPDCAQEGCHFDVNTQADVIPRLRSELDNYGLRGTMVSCSDENTYDRAKQTWNDLASAQSSVGRVNVHGYQGYNGDRAGLSSSVYGSGKQLWNSEYGDADGSGMSMVGNLNQDLRWLRPSAWCYWQPFDSGGWGLIASNPGDNWVGSANDKYFLLAQYTRHIREGFAIIQGGSDGNTVAAYNPGSKKLVIVCVNYGTAQWINFDLSNFGTVNGPVTRWMTQTGSGEKYQQHNDTSLSGKTFRSWFPANTVQTFEIQNVSQGVGGLGGSDFVSSSGVSSSGGISSGSTYKIISRNSGKAMDAAGQGTGNGTQIIQWPYWGGAGQRWTLYADGNGAWYIQGVQSGKFLDISGWGTSNDTKVQLWDGTGGTNQRFVFGATDSGYYAIAPSYATGSCVDVYGVSTADGAVVHLWQYLSGGNQQWSFQWP